MQPRGDTDKADPDAIALVKELDGLPLALSTAGAYLEHVTTSFSDYLRLHKASWLKLQATSPPLASYEDRSLYTTWQITLDQIEQENAASAKLLKLWAYFDRQDLWFELLRHGSSTDEEWMQVLTEDELSFNNAIRLLCNYGLVDPESSFPGIYRSGGYSIHSCVHSWTIFVLNKEWDQSLARLALTCVASKIPCTNMENWWLLQRRLLQHAIRQENFIMEGKVNSEGLDWTLHTLGDLYKDQGNLAKAEAMYIRALQGKEEALGPKYTSTLKTVNNLGLLYFDQGKLAKAEAMYIRALQGKEEVLGPKHTSTLMTVNNLGLLYSDQDNTADAKAMYIRALQGREEVLGLKNTYTLQTVNNLGVLYRNQGKLADAEAMFKRALQGYEEALGSKHTSTLDTVNNLGILYSKQGKLAEAEAMSKRALQGREETLGLKHILTLDTVNNLGNLYKNQGKLAEAEAMYIRALQGYKDSLSPELLLSYLPALNTMFTFGDLFLQTGRKDMAREMYSQALYGYTTVQEPSSKWCRQLEDRLHTLEVESAE